MEFNELVRKWPDMTPAEQRYRAGLLSEAQYMELIVRVKHAPNSNAEMLCRELLNRTIEKMFK